MEESVLPTQLDGPPSPQQPNADTPIKTEHSDTPRAQTPTASAVYPSVDDDTAKAIAAAQNEYSTRRVPRRSMIDKLPTPEADDKASPSPHEPKRDTAALPTPAPAKKRPAPKSVQASMNGIKKPPAKKRKLEPQNSEERAISAKNRSATPASTTVSSRGGKSSTLKSGSRKASHAGTPASSSPAPAASPAPGSSAAGSDNEDDDGVYCICRQGDNHTFMIACDGPCEDWYHGKCVNMVKDDQDLVDKYFCPICTDGGKGVTTWKPMCRRDGCRRPARLKKSDHSKYCTDECGVRFMQSKTEHARAAAAAIARGAVKNSEKGVEEPDLGPLGGVIRAHELKVLAGTAPNAEAFRRLGDSPYLTPPPADTTKSPEAQHNPGPTSPTAEIPTTPPTTDPIHVRLSEIATLKSTLRSRRALLKDRDHFVTLAKERATRLATAAKLKDFCGYDARLSWADTEFRTWRESGAGASAFSRGTLDNDAGTDGDVKAEDGDVAMEDARPALKPRPEAHRTNTSETVNGAGLGVGEETVCARRRCQRHVGWQKLVLHDVRFEEAETRAEMRRVDDEERELRGRVEGRAWMGAAGEGDSHSVVQVADEDVVAKTESEGLNDGLAVAMEVDGVGQGESNGLGIEQGDGMHDAHAAGTVEVVV